MNGNSEILNFLGKFSKHYENFPVASFLLPKSQRNIIRIVYWFARTADDIADENFLSDEQRIQLLEQFENQFNLALIENSELTYMNFLSQIIKEKHLSHKLFRNLLKAFKQDIIKNRYENFDEVLSYCLNSANPIGRLVLECFDYRDKKLFEYSDKICTALQLINFIQDTQIDIKKNRLYYPLNELRSFNITADDILNLNFNADVRDYFKFNVTRARDLLNSGKPLINYLKGNLAIEIKWTIFGGEEILNKIAKANYNVMSFRPTISKFNYAKIFLKSLF